MFVRKLIFKINGKWFIKETLIIGPSFLIDKRKLTKHRGSRLWLNVWK